MKNVFDDPLFKAVREAGAKLEDKHFVWMVDAVLAHFAKLRAQMHDDIVRLERFPDAGRFHVYGEAEGTPADHLARAKRFLGEYEDVMAFAVALKRVASEMNARRFAERFFRQRRAG
jgi:hypothetical protein